MELVARTDTLHLDTYSISAGKVLWNFHGGEKGAGTPPGWADTNVGTFRMLEARTRSRNVANGHVREGSPRLTWLRCFGPASCWRRSYIVEASLAAHRAPLTDGDPTVARMNYQMWVTCLVFKLFGYVDAVCAGMEVAKYRD